MGSSAVGITELSVSQQETLQKYTEITGQDGAAAVRVLQCSQWNVGPAIQKFFNEKQSAPASEALPVQNMAVNTGFPPISDLGTLMRSEMKEYWASLPKDLPMDPKMMDPKTQPKSIEDVKVYVESHIANFRDYRHSRDSKVDRVRTAIGKSLGVVQSISNVAGFAVGIAFPPAAPVFTAVNCLIFAGNSVSADFDNLMGFLDEVGDCLNSISIVEDYVHMGKPIPELDQDFKKVFAAILNLCGISTSFIHKGRLTRALMHTVTGNDGGLGQANIKLKTAMLNLCRSIQNGTFAGVVRLNQSIGYLQKQVDEILGTVHQIAEDVVEVKGDVVQMKGQVDTATNILREMSKPTIERIRKFFENYAVKRSVGDEMWRAYVVGTADWMLKDPNYTTWCGDADNFSASWGRGLFSLLWIHGLAGIGKSMLAFKVTDVLTTYSQLFRVSVAYFSFQDENSLSSKSQKCSSLTSAISNAIIQVAEKDELYRNSIAEFIRANEDKNSESMSALGLWNKFIAEQYSDNGRYPRGKLYLLLDGVEKMNTEDEKALLEIISQIITNKLNVKLLLFGDSGANGNFERVGGSQLPSIEVTGERIRDGIKLFINYRVGKFRISLTDAQKDKIITTLAGNRGGFAFVSASLDEIEKTEQPEDIPDILNSLPTTYKGLLEGILYQILRKLSSAGKDEMKATKLILYLCAFCGAMTVKEIKCILRIKTKYQNFNVEGVVKNTCGSLLELQDINEDGTEVVNSVSETKIDSSPVGNSGANESQLATRDTDIRPSNSDGNKLVRFRNPGFAKCFKDHEWTAKASNAIIEPAELVALELTTILTRVLSCLPTDPQYEKTRDVENYATALFFAPIYDIDPGNASDDYISQVFKSLMQVYTTPGATSLAYERLHSGSGRISQLVRSIGKARNGLDTTELDKVFPWFTKAYEIGRERLKLASADFEWLKMVVDSPPRARRYMLQISQELIRHWFTEVDYTQVKSKFDLAAAWNLIAEGTFEDFKIRKPLVLYESDIITLPDKLISYDGGEDSYRAIGITLSDCGFYERAIEYYLKAEQASRSFKGKFHTSVHLGCAYLKLQHFKEAEGVLSSVLEMRKSLSESDNSELLQNLLCLTYCSLGDMLIESGLIFSEENATQRAVEAYEKAIFYNRANPDKNVKMRVGIIQTLFLTHNLEALIDKVRSWDAKECASWLLEERERDVEPRHEQFLNAAIEKGRVNDLLGCFKAAISATGDTGDALLLQVDLGSIYWKVVGNEDLAYQDLCEVVENNDLSPDAKKARDQACLVLSEMMYGRIQREHVVWVRRVLTTNMAHISRKYTATTLDIWNLNPNIPLAAAYVACDQRNDAEKLLDEPFSLCIGWLGDDLASNDTTTLRLLSRLLSCVGLHRDAAIAYSAHFSRLAKYPDSKENREYYHLEEPDHEVAAQDIGRREIAGNGKDPAGKDLQYESQVNLGGGNKPTEPVEKSSNSEGNIAPKSEDLAGPGIEDKRDGNIAQREQATIDSTENHSSGAARLIPADDEDVAQEELYCNGCGDRFYEYWDKDKPAYMCIICTDMDLCSKCYGRRTAPITDESTDKAPIFCGVNHDYVKAPIEGWGGVKNGLMSIHPEKVEFKHWLGDVERKWKEWKQTGNLLA